MSYASKGLVLIGMNPFLIPFVSCIAERHTGEVSWTVIHYGRPADHKVLR